MGKRRIQITESDLHQIIKECVKHVLNEWDSQGMELNRRTSNMLGDYSRRYSDIDDKNNERWHRDYQTDDGGINSKRAKRQYKAFSQNEDPLAMRQKAYDMVGNNKNNPQLAKHIMRNTRGNTPYTSKNPSTPIDKNFDMDRMLRNQSDRARHKFTKPM